MLLLKSKNKSSTDFWNIKFPSTGHDSMLGQFSSAFDFHYTIIMRIVVIKIFESFFRSPKDSS